MIRFTKNISAIILAAVLLLALLAAVEASATEEYAAATGAKCGFCHVDSLGGGPLTEAGQGYRLCVLPAAGAGHAGPGVISRGIRLFSLYLHILTGFMWFGTILYVHLVLKPAYASQGLPRGEVRVGLVSMAVMAVTGTVLTLFRIDSWHQLVSSRFGILLLAKIIIFAIMVASALYVVLVIGPKLKRRKLPSVPASGEFSPAELAAFDGGEGRQNYISYKGKVYDVGSSRLWRHGSHMKRHQAGVDLTGMLAQAPHGEDKVLAMPVVGRYSEAKTVPPAAAGSRKVFYFMAYMNLAFVFVVTLILALWRW